MPLPDVIEEGTKVQFSCTANVGKPPGNIKWWRFKPNKAVPDHLGELSTTPTMVEDVCVYNLTSSILAYTMSRNDDQSVFRCSVSNDLVKADKDYDNPHEDTKTIRVLCKSFFKKVFLNDFKNHSKVDVEKSVKTHIFIYIVLVPANMIYAPTALCDYQISNWC